MEITQLLILLVKMFWGANQLILGVVLCYLHLAFRQAVKLTFCVP